MLLEIFENLHSLSFEIIVKDLVKSIKEGISWQINISKLSCLFLITKKVSPTGKQAHKVIYSSRLKFFSLPVLMIKNSTGHNSIVRGNEK